ncbi:MAG: hypothetical protein GF364_15675 [Candidatus Lokiarchaeota archaeon]|nr:hypothetical protein [Candidatus Lokiarchaeota archaeon]
MKTLSFNDEIDDKERKCEQCGSQRLTENREGFIICKECGLEQSSESYAQQTRFDENQEVLDHSFFSKTSRTTVGNKKERVVREKFKKLEKYQKYNSYVYETTIFRHAYPMIRGICSRLRMPINMAQDAFGVFKRVWKKLPPKTQMRSLDSLIPVVVYRTAQMLEYSVNFIELLNAIDCDDKKLKSVLISTYQLFPTIDKRNDVISQINRICDEMDMAYEIRIRSIKILNANKSVMLSTTNNIAACASIGLAILTLGLRKEYRLYKIGRNNHASASAISARIFKVIKHRNIHTKSYKICQIEDILLNKLELLTD